MKHFICKRSLLLNTFIAICALLATSCNKTPGQDVTKADNGTGIGPIAVGATNTFIYQVDGGPIVTCTTADYQVNFLIGTKPAATLVSAYNPSNHALITLEYEGTSTGTFTATGGALQTSTLTKASPPGVERINVTTQTITGTQTGTIKGTFDGKMTDQSGSNSVRVTGSFNITQ